MPVLTTILTTLTLSNITECVINGTFENLPSHTPKLADRLKKQFSDDKPEVNAHLQKAVLSAHWMATKVFVEQMHKKDLLKNSYYNVNQSIKKELKELKNENYQVKEIGHDAYGVTKLINLPQEDVGVKLESDILEFHLKLLDLKTGEVKKLEDYKKLKELIQNGWKDENLNWFQLMTAFLNQLLKGDNNKAKDAFQNQTLAEIKLKLDDFEQYAENCIQGIGEDRFRGFEDYLKEEISGIKVSLNQLHDKFDTFSSETKEEFKKLTDAISSKVPKEFYGRTDLLKLIGELDEIHLLFQKEQIKRKGFLDLLKLGANEDFLNEQLNEVDIEVLKVDGLKRNKLDEIKDFINYTTKNYLDFISNEIKNDKELIRIAELYKSGKFEDAENVIDSKRHQDSVRRRLELKEVEIVRDKILSDKSTFLANDTLAKKETHWFEKANKYFSETVALFPSYDTYSRYALFLQNHRQFEKADIEYKKALRHTSNNVQIALTLNRLGNTQCENHELEKAGLSFGKALEIVRDLTKGSPSIYKHDLTMTLNNLGNLHRQKNEFESAECSYKESIQISRDLAKETPSIHLPDLAMTLNNLGDLFRKKNEFKNAELSYKESLEIRRYMAKEKRPEDQSFLADTLNSVAGFQSASNELVSAETSYNESLKIYRDLAELNPYTYLSYVVMSLNNLGNLYKAKSDLLKAEKCYEEALGFTRKLTSVNPKSYKPNLAMILNNLGNFYIKRKEIEKAEANYKEAVEIRRNLAEFDPKGDLSDLAMVLNNLAVLQREKNNLTQSELSHLEALKIRRNLVVANPKVYLPDLAFTLSNLAGLQCDKNELTEAEKNYKEALKIYRQFAVENPMVYQLELAATLIGLSIFYFKHIPVKEKSISMAFDAFMLSTPFLGQVPRAGEYCQTASRLWNAWGEDLKKHLEGFKSPKRPEDARPDNEAT